MLYITTHQYRGHEVTVKELTTSTSPMSSSYNLVVDFKKVTNSQEPAKTYVIIEKDSIRDENGEVKLNYHVCDISGNMVKLGDDSDY